MVFDATYRVEFVGGPMDGAIEEFESLPNPLIAIRSPSAHTQRQPHDWMTWIASLLSRRTRELFRRSRELFRRSPEVRESSRCAVYVLQVRDSRYFYQHLCHTVATDRLLQRRHVELLTRHQIQRSQVA